MEGLSAVCELHPVQAAFAPTTRACPNIREAIREVTAES